MPHSKYIRSEDDPKRYCISVPVNYKLQIVLDYINEFIENNLDQIITYTDRQKVFFKSYKPEYICASGHKKSPFVNTYFRYDYTSRKITSMIYEIQDDGSKVQNKLHLKSKKICFIT